MITTGLELVHLCPSHAKYLPYHNILLMVYFKPATLMHDDVLSVVIVVSRVVITQMVYNSLFAVVYIPHQWQCIPHHSGGNYTSIV